MTQTQWFVVSYLVLGSLAAWRMWEPITAQIPVHLLDDCGDMCGRHRRQHEIFVWISTGALFVGFVLVWAPVYLAVLLYVIAQLRRR